MSESTSSGNAAVAAITNAGLIPVIRASSPEIAIRVAEALIDAGAGVIEITMTVPGALSAIEALVARFASAAVIGAGTITSVSAASAALSAGAAFIVTPCLLPDVIDAAHSAGQVVIPGALTPTEVFTAVQHGADLVKIYPAANVGGPSYLKALSGPFPDLALVPTGGITLQNVGDYIKAGAVAVGVGGELILRDAIKAGDFAAIGALATRFLEAIAAARRA